MPVIIIGLISMEMMTPVSDVISKSVAGDEVPTTHCRSSFCEESLGKIPLNWVGMSDIKMTALIRDEKGELYRTPIKISSFVNLIQESRGIHMSRMYVELKDYFSGEEFNEQGLFKLAKRLHQTQKELSSAVKMEIHFDLTFNRVSLESSIAYTKSYPVKLTFENDEFSYETVIDYSSTCPQSALLSREYFLNQIRQRTWNDSKEIIDWIEKNGTLATPHAQRSHLHIKVKWKNEETYRTKFDFLNELINDLEQVLGTPTQGPVKRVDEQAFAVSNARNLMFCEDAARKIKSHLDKKNSIKSYCGKVEHVESLHSHNAVAFFSND